jgi:hypothetical protein
MIQPGLVCRTKQIRADVDAKYAKRLLQTNDAGML